MRVFWRSRTTSTDPASPFPRVDGLTIRAALLLGFGITLGTWLFAGSYFAKRIENVSRGASAMGTRYMKAQERLATVRAQVLLGSIYLRDALLDPDLHSAEAYRQRIGDAYEAARVSLADYQPVLDTAEERAHIDRLRLELDEFGATLAGILADGDVHWVEHAREQIRLRIVPKRELVIRLSDDVQTANRSAFVQQQAETAAIYSQTERQIWFSLGACLLISLGVALLATTHGARLERRLHSEGLRVQQHARDLQRLSAKLVSVQENERRAIARELHDEVGQVLTAIKVELAVAQRTIGSAGGPAHLLDDARAIADRALHTVRDLSHLLHPAVLDDLGLPAALDSYLRDFEKRHGVRIDWEHDGMADRVAPEAEATMYRIAQEALTNVARHADAKVCRVRLQRLPTTLLMTIDDDGRGFDPASGQRTEGRPGLGLLGIRERVTQLFGTWRLESAPGQGTRLTVVLPAVARQMPEEATSG